MVKGRERKSLINDKKFLMTHAATVARFKCSYSGLTTIKQKKKNERLV